MNFAIDIKKGIDNLLFDMTIEEVKQILGQPTEEETIDNIYDEHTQVLIYEELEMTLFFEGETKKLNCIDVENEAATLFGKNIFSMNEREIGDVMVANGYYREDIEVEMTGERAVSFNDANVDFFFEEDALVSVTLGK